MNNSPNMRTEPKSDQLNYDNIPNGKTITITIARVTGNADPQQPISVHYEGDGGKPYKPGLSMRRIMEAAWGSKAIEYVGKSMTLFGDPTVRFGPNAVGGIRISHMSHIDKDMSLPLTISKGMKKPYFVKLLKVDMDNTGDDEEVDNTELLSSARVAAKQGKEIFTKYFNTNNEAQRDIIKTIMPELQKLCEEADKPTTDEDPFNEQTADAPTSNSEGQAEEGGEKPGDSVNSSPEPITDESKWLTKAKILLALDDCGTVEEVDNLITCQSLGIAEKSDNEQVAIMNAANDRKAVVSDA